jgi:hypothetical protein
VTSTHLEIDAREKIAETGSACEKMHAHAVEAATRSQPAVDTLFHEVDVRVHKPQPGDALKTKAILSSSV